MQAMKSMTSVRVLILGCLLLTAAGMSPAQTLGEITGEVSDPSGAAVPNVPVTATNGATNVVRSTLTNSDGIYSFPGLIPGIYGLKVAAPGFNTVVKSNIELQVQQTVRIDFSLTLGQATQTIEVSASAALLSTENC